MTTTQARLEHAIPVLPVLAIPEAVRFYGDRLGFAAEFEYDDYAGVGRDGVVIHFWRCDDAEIAKVSSYRANVQAVDVLHGEMQAAGVVHPNGPLSDKPWGIREFTILDHCGNAIVFGEALPEAEQSADD